MAVQNTTHFLAPYGWDLGESGWKDATDLWIQRLDGLLKASVIDRDLTAPPGGPTTGDLYIVGGSATGAWATYDNQIAMWDGTTWRFTIVPKGFKVWVEDEKRMVYWTSTAWEEFIEGKVVSASSAAAAIDFDLALGSHFQVTLTESITTVTFSNVPATGYKRPITIEFLQDATGSWAVSGWPAAVKWPGGTAPTITTAIGAYDVIEGFTLDGGTTIRLARTMADTK